MLYGPLFAGCLACIMHARWFGGQLSFSFVNTNSFYLEKNALFLLSLKRMLYGLSFDKCSSVSHDLLVCLPHNFFLNLFYFYPVYIFFIIYLNTLFWATKLKKIRKMSGIGIEYFLMITKRHICNINSIRFCALDCHTNRKDYPWCKNWTSFIMMCTLISYRKNIKLFQKRLFIAYILSAVSVLSLWNIHIAFAFIM